MKPKAVNNSLLVKRKPFKITHTSLQEARRLLVIVVLHGKKAHKQA